MRGPDQFEKPLVLNGPIRKGLLEPGVITATVTPKNPAPHSHAVFVTVGSDERVLYPRSFVNYAATDSTGQRNTPYPSVRLEGGAHGTNRTTQFIRRTESKAVETMEERAIPERYRPCIGRARRVHSRCCVVERRDRF